MPPSIYPIVEGHGDVKAVPVLLRRILGELGRYDLFNEIAKPSRTRRNQITKEGKLEREITRVSLFHDCKAILVILDSDEDCAAQLGPELECRAKEACLNQEIVVTLPVVEYES